MLLEIAIGDACGAGMEYVSPRFLKENNHLRGYCKHPRYRTGLGRYTDDAQMAIAIAEAMIDGDVGLEEVEWTPRALAEKFVSQTPSCHP